MRRNSVIALMMIVASGLGGCATQTSNERAAEALDRTKVAEINTKLAIAYMQDGDNELALKKLERALEADTNFALAYSTRALVYHRIGEYDKADANFNQALKLDPNNAAVLNNYGQTLCQREAYEKGQEMILRATKNPLYRTPEIALNNAGICAMQAGDKATAERHLREALEINPTIPSALIRMSSLSYDAGRYLPARGYLQRYLETSRHTAETLWLGIRIERALGDKDALASYSLQLEKNFPDSVEAGLLLESQETR